MHPYAGCSAEYELVFEGSEGSVRMPMCSPSRHRIRTSREVRCVRGQWISVCTLHSLHWTPVSQLTKLALQEPFRFMLAPHSGQLDEGFG